jgi:hypothetical protein
MWLALIKLIGGPVVSGLITAYQAYLTSKTQDATIAADLAAKEIAAQSAEMQAQANLKIAEIGHPWEPEKLAFYVTLVFYAKCVIWDKVLALGSTDPLHGDVSTWAGMIMAFYFGKRTFENVARIIKR